MKNVEITGKLMSFNEHDEFMEKEHGKGSFLMEEWRAEISNLFTPIKANLERVQYEDGMAINPYVLALETLIDSAEDKISRTLEFIESKIGLILLYEADGRNPEKKKGELLAISVDATENGTVPEFDKIFTYDVEVLAAKAKRAAVRAKTNETAGR
jgi:hypothetical protein